MNEIILNGVTLEQIATAVVNLLQQRTTLAPQPKKEDENDFIGRDEVCTILKFNKTTLHKHTRSGRLKSYGIGNRVLYKRSEVLQAVKPINH